MGTDTFHVAGRIEEKAVSRHEWRAVAILQVLFLAVALVGLDGPFVSTHFLRQNQTYDVARHVFHEGWSAVLTPRASFSQLSRPDDIYSPLVTPAPPFTIIHLEVPFHGLIGWPAAALFPQHERAVVRLVSVLFSLLSIQLLYAILRRWLEPAPAWCGVALWTTTPLFVHFGQAANPDILATTGMAAAFFFALRGQLAASSAAFLFTILAKLSIIIYGLPLLTALVLARNCRSLVEMVRVTLAWGLMPLVGLVAWLSLSLHDPPGSWVVFGGFRPGDYGPVQLSDLLQLAFYVLPLLYLFPFGCGLMGWLGLFFAVGTGGARMNPWLKAAILLSLVVNYAGERIVWREPQYMLPVLFWLSIASAFGFPRLLEWWHRNQQGKLTLGCALLFHLMVVAGSVYFLKASRVPNVADIEAAGRLTPVEARLVVYAGTASASPSAWLNRNTLKFNPFGENPDPGQFKLLEDQLQSFSKAGFAYLVVFDIEQQHSLSPVPKSTLSYATHFTEPSSATRRFFDARYQKLFEGDHVVLYRLSGS